MVYRETRVPMPAGDFQETKAVSSSIIVAFTSTGGPAGAVGTDRLSMKPLELQRPLLVESEKLPCGQEWIPSQ